MSDLNVVCLNPHCISQRLECYRPKKLLFTMATPFKKRKGKDAFVKSIHCWFRSKKYFYKCESASSCTTDKSHRLNAIQHCTNWALYLRGGIILLSISPSLRNVPKTYTGHISPYDILLYILPLCSATSMGNLYAWSSFTKWKNVTTELRMLCEETNRKCNIYNSLSVYFVFFSFFNFFQVKMQQLAFFCVCNSYGQFWMHAWCLSHGSTNSTTHVINLLWKHWLCKTLSWMCSGRRQPF